MHGTLRMPSERQEGLTEPAAVGGAVDSAEARAERLLAAGYRSRLTQLGMTLKLTASMIGRVRENLRAGSGPIAAALLARIEPLLGGAEVATETALAAGANAALALSGGALIVEVASNGGPLPPRWQEAEGVTAPVLELMDAIGAVSDQIAKALLATNVDFAKADDLDMVRFHLSGALNYLNIEMAVARKLLADASENRAARPVTKGAERLRRMRRRKRLGFAGTVSVEYHKQELEILRRLRLIGPDASQEEIQTAMRAFLLSAFSFLDFPSPSHAEYRRTHREFLAALQEYRDGTEPESSDGRG